MSEFRGDCIRWGAKSREFRKLFFFSFFSPREGEKLEGLDISVLEMSFFLFSWPGGKIFWFLQMLLDY